MADQVGIAGTGEVAELRDPTTAALLSFVTCGIYGILWYYWVAKELVALGQAKQTDELGDNPTTTLLALTIGACVIVPPIVSIINSKGRIDNASRLTGVEPLGGATIFFMLLLAPLGIYMCQEKLNEVWAAQASQGGAPAAAPAV